MARGSWWRGASSWWRRGDYSFTAAVIAVLLGAILLIVSYVGLSEKEHFWREFTHEIGFALIVAVVIWVTFEFFSHSAREKQWLSRTELISKTVFMGVFRRRLPEAIMNELTRLVLNTEVIRSFIRITLTISDSEFRSRTGETRKFVLLNTRVNMKLTNVSEDMYALPLTAGLPNPLINEMKDFCKVNRVAYKQGDDSKEIEVNLVESEKLFREAIKDDNQFSIAFKCGNVDMPSNSEIEVFWDYTMAKDEEDSELFQTLSPTEKLIVTIHDENYKKRFVMARSIHRCDLHKDPTFTSGTYTYSLDNYILPHQGLVVWWKNIPASPASPQPSNAEGVDTAAPVAQDARR